MRPSLANIICLAAAASVLWGCASSRPAPVSERTLPGGQAAAKAPVGKPTVVAKPTSGAPDVKGETYTVKPGDTLQSIALEHGVDYRELAIWNGIDNPGGLRVGQQLRVTPPAGAVVTAPLKSAPGTVQAKPLGTQPSTPATVPSAPPTPSSSTVVSEPKGLRVPYSEQAFAQLSRGETTPAPRVEAPRAESRPEIARPENDSARSPDDLDWTWPARGKVISTFNDSTHKGIAIAGKLGQPVLASAPGRVIFSGAGIRGFGKLIVIRHNEAYLSVYAHNNELNVKEGQNVSRGQKIAEMGNSDADQVKLYFEIRRFRKPVDPLKLLPAG